MSEMGNALRMLSGKFPTGIQQVNFPIYKGKPNPAHGKFYFVGSIPASCYDTANRRSKKYDTEDEAIRAAIAGGAERIQGVDCRFINFADYAP